MKSGIIIKSTGSNYKVKHNNEVFNCKIRGIFRSKNLNSTNPVTVGDLVDFDIIDPDNKQGVITFIHERKNSLVRKSTNLSKKTHILAANIDLAVLMVTIIDPVGYTMFIDRFLAGAEQANIKAKIVFNKIDILNENERQKLNYMSELYSKIGYECLKISVLKQQNINEFKEMITGKNIIIVGNSGVGKTSLLNLIAPSLNLKTSQISDSHRQGKHTTTFAEMFDIGYAQIIDSPGIKGFGLIDIGDVNLADCFVEMRALRHECKFKNCTHTHEPNCRIKQAVADNEINPERYNNYLKILEGKDDKYRENIYK